MIYNNYVKNKLNPSNANFKLRTRWIDAKNEVIHKNKQVNLSK